MCGTDVVGFKDPHADLSSPKYWTHSGYQKDLHLEDGPYYVAVQALNKVVYGGALVTTVCHSTPFTVDTTPPVFLGVNHIMFDEDFDILGVYFEGFDTLSKLKRVDFGLGKTKYDVGVRGYTPHPYVDRKDTYIGIEDLGLEPGVPAWIRIRLVNNGEAQCDIVWQAKHYSTLTSCFMPILYNNNVPAKTLSIKVSEISLNSITVYLIWPNYRTTW